MIACLFMAWITSWIKWFAFNILVVLMIYLNFLGGEGSGVDPNHLLHYISRIFTSFRAMHSFTFTFWIKSFFLFLYHKVTLVIIVQQLAWNRCTIYDDEVWKSQKSSRNLKLFYPVFSVPALVEHLLESHFPFLKIFCVLSPL